LREPLPDVLGLALRILDAHGPGRHQDLLFASSLDLPLGRELFVPTLGFRGAALSSVLPYRLGSTEPVWLGAHVTDATGATLTRLAGLARAIAADDVQVAVRYATRFGPWRTLADVELGERLGQAESDGLSFNVDDNTGGGIAPAGWLQALRRHAYTASQLARR
jgi:hypothetical protein